MANKIGWCDATLNPVWGCRRIKGCVEYCYARGIAKRFGAVRFMEEWKYRTEHNMDAVRFKLENSLDLIEFRPTFLHSQFNKKLPKRPQRIFVGSMSEIAHWEREWVEKVLDKIKQYPQHVFQFLTRNPRVYSYYAFPGNCWLGITITNNADLRGAYFSPHLENIKFISIEPLLEEIEMKLLCRIGVDWIIMGAETGNRKGRVIPEIEWINKIVGHCRANSISIYLKDSLKKIYPPLYKAIPINDMRDIFLSYKPIKEFPKRTTGGIC